MFLKIIQVEKETQSWGEGSVLLFPILRWATFITSSMLVVSDAWHQGFIVKQKMGRHQHFSLSEINIGFKAEKFPIKR